jgi:hypothetical protein
MRAVSQKVNRALVIDVEGISVAMRKGPAKRRR